LKLAERTAIVLDRAVGDPVNFDEIRRALEVAAIAEFEQLPQYLTDEYALVRFAAELVLDDLQVSCIRKIVRRIFVWGGKILQ